MEDSFDIETVTPDIYRQAMARFPAGVAVLTTRDAEGIPRGFTATSFCSLSADPPTVLVCLAKRARCHTAFVSAPAWAAHLVDHEHTDVARRFGSDAADKFAGTRWEPHRRGLPVLAELPVMLCRAVACHDAGDHSILVGTVAEVRTGNGAPVVYFGREFHALPQTAAVGERR